MHNLDFGQVLRLNTCFRFDAHKHQLIFVVNIYRNSASESTACLSKIRVAPIDGNADLHILGNEFGNKLHSNINGVIFQIDFAIFCLYAGQ